MKDQSIYWEFYYDGCVYSTPSKKIFHQSFLSPKPWHWGNKCCFNCVIK